MRTWILWRMTDMTWRSTEHEDIGGPIEVIELQPVVEMLKRTVEDAYEELFAPSEIIDFIDKYGG